MAVLIWTQCLILTRRFPWAVFTGWSSFSHVMDGLGMPLAMHCKVTGLCLTTVFSGRSEDLIVGGTRWKEGKEREWKTAINDITDRRAYVRHPWQMGCAKGLQGHRKKTLGHEVGICVLCVCVWGVDTGGGRMRNECLLSSYILCTRKILKGLIKTYLKDVWDLKL